MKFFLDTAMIEEIKQAKAWGFLDGITTNPSLAAKTGRPFEDLAKEILKIVAPAPVSLEVVATDVDGMIREGLNLAQWGINVVVKIPMTEAGMAATQTLSQKHGIRINVTLVFSANQAILAAKAGASYVSPFIGRLDDVGQDGMKLIAEIVDIYKNYSFSTQVLVASVRHPMHVTEAARLGAHVATMPFGVLRQLFKHPLTDKGLAAFLEDWKKVPAPAKQPQTSKV
ncbi:MAG: fructose-6-phosphate aldolase [Elusimicrobia bacterium]|nr:fructose-6-phosphate aldolase [Elusimicrobiota bacterium]